MTKRTFDEVSDRGFSVGLPAGMILCGMLGITAYLFALSAEITPPSTKVYLASEIGGKP